MAVSQHRISSVTLVDDTGARFRAEMAELDRATFDELTAEMRKVLTGKGYESPLPAVRTSREGRASRRRAGRKPTRRNWRVRSVRRRAGSYVQVWAPPGPGQRLAGMLESAPTIRGHRNVWHEAVIRGLRAEWPTIAQLALQRAPQRIRSNRLRAAKARDARLRRAAAEHREYLKSIGAA